jgi:hypothetical protein
MVIRQLRAHATARLTHSCLQERLCRPRASVPRASRFRHSARRRSAQSLFNPTRPARPHLHLFSNDSESASGIGRAVALGAHASSAEGAENLSTHARALTDSALTTSMLVEDVSAESALRTSVLGEDDSAERALMTTSALRATALGENPSAAESLSAQRR